MVINLLAVGTMFSITFPGYVKCSVRSMWGGDYQVSSELIKLSWNSCALPARARVSQLIRHVQLRLCYVSWWSVSVVAAAQLCLAVSLHRASVCLWLFTLFVCVTADNEREKCVSPSLRELISAKQWRAVSEYNSIDKTILQSSVGCCACLCKS